MSELVTYPQLVIPRNAAFKPMQDCGAYEGTVNCNPAGSSAMANWFLGQTPGVAQVTHHAFRLAAGNPKVNGLPVGLSSSQTLAGLTALGVPATRHYGESVDLVPAALQRGAAVGLCVDYPTITALAPQLSGQPTFKKGHFLVVTSWRYHDPLLGKANSVLDHDTLFDGRHRPGYTAPEGPQVGAWDVFAKALGNFRVGGATYDQGRPIGAGKGIFIIVEAA